MDWQALSGKAELFWSWASAVVIFGSAALAGGHVVLTKRDLRAAIGWLGLIVLVPPIGTILYLLLGINRIRRKAAMLRRQAAIDLTEPPQSPFLPPAEWPQLRALAQLMERVTGEPLRAGHRVTPLDNGDEAYPRMLAAIEAARHSICLSSYIFEPEGPGRDFIDALTRAHERGVAVRVMIDAVGLRYARPRTHRVLQQRGVRTAAFLPARWLGYSRYYNLRSHRKILAIDGEQAFTGGMNIRRGHVLAARPPHPVRDMHFEIEGPVVGWLTRVFAEDWEFCTGEVLEGEPFFREDVEPRGPVLARGVVDGPDHDLDKFRWALLGGVSCARSSVRVVTPYFLPDSALMSALELAAMRGVSVDVVLPERGNLTVVNWAMRAHLQHAMATPVRYWLTPEPFDHTKLLVVDEAWSLIGSANWDPRSLRLNFEIGVECYDEPLARDLACRVDARIASARRLTERELASRSFPVKLRDSLARLLTPYL